MAAMDAANEMEMTMKKLLLTAAVTAALATPAFAQSYNPDMGTGNIVNPVAQNRAGTDAFAFAPRANGQVHQQSWRAQRVYQDPNIELEQRRSAQY
jgi:hypothetical protein